jgi:sigma-B regulation protein RsbU (phosphoserine phosphatase)
VNVARQSFHVPAAGYLAALIGIGAVTAIFVPLRDIVNTTTVVLAYLLAVLLAATLWGTRPALVATALAAAGIDYFFIPPPDVFNLPDKQDWLELVAFLIVAVTAGQLPQLATRRGKRAESQLAYARLATARSRTLLEASPDALVTLDMHGGIDDANSAIEIMTGRPLSTIAGTDFASYCAEPDEAREAFRTTLRDGFVRDWPLELRHVDGHLTSVFYSASLRLDDDGRVIGVVAAVRPMLTSPARKSIPADVDAVRFVARLVVFACGLSVAAGLVGVVGWTFDIGPMKSLIPGEIPITPNTAFALIACGCALWLLRVHNGKRPSGSRLRVGRLLAVLVALIGLAGTVEYVFGWDLGIDQILFVLPPSANGVLHPGQMTPISAFNFLLIGLALLLLDWTIVLGGRRFQPAQFLAFGINTAASVALLDYVLRAHPSAVHEAPRSALTQFVLSIAIVCARRSTGVGALIVSRSLGGMLARRLWPATVAVPLLIGMASHKAYTAALLSREAAMTMTIVVMITLLAGLTVWSGMGIDRSDLQRRGALAALHRREEELREAQRLARVGSWWWDPVTDGMAWSEELYRIAGCDPKLPPPRFDDHSRCFYSPTSWTQLSAAVAAAKRAGTPFALELELVRPDGDIRLVTSRGEAERDASGRVTLVRGSIQDITERKREERELVRLNRALRALSLCNLALTRTTDEATWLYDVCHIVTEVAGYRFCWVGRAEYDDAKHVTAVAEAGVDEGYLQAVNITWSSAEPHLGPTGRAISTMERQIIMDTSTDPSFAPWRAEAEKRGYASIISIPLVVAGERWGALSIYATEADVFSAEEAELLGELAADLGYGVTTLRLRAEQQRTAKEIRRLNADLEQRVLDRTADLEAAREREATVGFRIQQMLLLTQPPTDVPGVQIAALTIPSQRVDGDFYDFFKHDDQCLDVIVADVMGKGVPAALLAAATKSNFLEALCHLIAISRRDRMPEPKEIVTLAHADMVRQLIDLESFVTLSYVRLDLARRRLELVDCGHTGMIAAHAGSEMCEIVHGDNLPLGIREGEIFDQTGMTFASGDLFLFFSDGLTELRNPAGESYGTDRLAASVVSHRALDPRSLVEVIRAEALAFAQSDRPNDDLTCVAVKIIDADRPLAHAEMDVESDLVYLRRVRTFVRDVCHLLPRDVLGDQEIAGLELAVNEAASNIMKHAYHGRRDQRIQLDGEAYADRIAIRLHHLGDPFDPTAVPLPAVDGSRESGFGIYLMANSVSEVRYSRDDRGQHCIALVQNRGA